MGPVLLILDGAISLFNMALILWCLLSWFPNVNRYDGPFRYLGMIVMPVLGPVKRVIPPVGNIDISPMVLMIALSFVQRILHSVL